ncbi:MAG: threo-3-hydroxy-L-aspartate ammonia-lyase [Phycisphaeraceae bacterium]|nr:threo-3-hydroxy-L-aspartate ammonia-lyase [Phycisphaeraceae bacterium]
MPDAPTIDDLRDAVRIVREIAHRTPVITCRAIDDLVGASVHLKCENLQRVGAFKIRGAFNAMSRLGDEQRRQGVIAYSSGNHAQAVALSARTLDIPAVIVMPSDAPRVKIQATRGYLEATRGEVVLYDRATQSREQVAREIATARGLTLIPPYDHPDIIAGQGTVALELFEETGPLDWLMVPCGGGGLLSGCAIAANAVSPACKVVGVEPDAADDAARTFRTGALQSVRNPDTIADGARTPSLGAHTMPIVCALAHDVITVSDREIVAAMRTLMERAKLVVEPTGALGLAGAIGLARQGRPGIAGSRIGVVLSGGNLELERLGEYLALEV